MEYKFQDALNFSRMVAVWNTVFVSMYWNVLKEQIHSLNSLTFTDHHKCSGSIYKTIWEYYVLSGFMICWFQYPYTKHKFRFMQVKNQLHAHFTHLKMFNYDPTYFEPITGSSSGMSQIIITHKIQQYKYNFWIQLFKIQRLFLEYG
jgi:hypothetical protein